MSRKLKRGYGHIAWVKFPNGLDSDNLIYHVRFDGDKPPSVPALVLETEEEHLKHVNNSNE